jgi:hypothetical protein
MLLRDLTKANLKQLATKSSGVHNIVKPTIFLEIEASGSIKYKGLRTSLHHNLHIIRRSLEQALGESAVVVCGPQRLVADVKQDVCSLSDERAVHKGTGAQGIYLHTESFSY